MQTTLISQSESQIVTLENGIEVTRTCKVFTRHSDGCSHVEDSQYQKCDCKKSLLKYSSLEKSNWRESAKTRKWSEAQRQASDWLNSFHPDKAELRAKEQEIARLNGKSAKVPTVQMAIGLYVANMKSDGRATKTIRNTTTLFGNADPDTGEIKQQGKFLPWLETQNSEPILISSIEPEMLTRWRITWKGADTTRANDHKIMKAFFNFCKQQGWFGNRPNPAVDIKSPKVKKGNRTAIFSDAQYEKIKKAADLNPRLLAIIELMRWGGMAGIDAVQFKLNSVDSRNVLRYKRQKTGKLAIVTLPSSVVERLKSVPLINGATKEQPFRYPDIKLESNREIWLRELQALCADLNLGEIRTELGKIRKPHLHMFRDTCAVYFLRHGLGVHEVAKVLGDTVAMVEAHYLPFVKELEEAHINKTKAILQASGAD